MSPTDNVVKDEADQNPGYIIERRRGGYAARDSENEREIEVLEELHVELLLEYPLYYWRNNTDQEEKQETVIELAMGEETLRSDHAPLLQQW